MNWLQKFYAVLTNGNTVRVSDTGPTPVGTGAPNEVQLVIHGRPHLFRDEGERIVHFVASFEPSLKPTRFGPKLLPSPCPHWEFCSEHSGMSLAAAVASAMRLDPTVPTGIEAHQRREPRPHERAGHATPAASRPATVSSGKGASVSAPGRARADAAVHVGRVRKWGESEFPDRKREGRTYISFAVWLDSGIGEQVLQGEGLKDAIAEAGCKVGDSVAIKRLRKVKVQAFERNGDPKVDPKGNPILWDKWLWSISTTH